MTTEERLINERTKKLEKIRESGINPYPYSYNQKDHARDILKKYSKLQKEKSDKLKEIIGTSDEKLKNLIGNSFVEWKEIGEQIIFAAQVYLKAKSKGVGVLTSIDHVTTNKYPDRYGNLPKEAELKVYNASTGIPEGWLGVSPGPKTLDIICKNVKNAYLIILAGPLSIEDERVEEFSQTNKKLFKAIKEAKSKGAVTIGAGGDTVATIKRCKGEDALTVISNAGGATLELIEKDGRLPGIVAIEECSSVEILPLK